MPAADSGPGVVDTPLPDLVMLKLGDTLDETQRRLALQRWTFEQLGGRQP